MGSEAVPHISLALSPTHQAKDLGPMVKAAVTTTDYQQTSIPYVTFSPSTNTYVISISTADTGMLTHDLLSRDHGREKSDHPHEQQMLSTLPDSLWSKGPEDIGLCSCPPVTFDLIPTDPIWLYQYPHKPEAAAGLETTVQGLLQAQVLESSYSSWNTPILPVEKPGTGKYRMVHDLRSINALLQTPTCSVPNPYVALTNLSPKQKWFTCIDLANAFFCLPLAEHVRDVFSFTFHGQQYRYTRLPQGFALSPGIFNQVLKKFLDDCPLPEGTTLLQYVDDLLIASETAQDCLAATHSVLLALYNAGFKVSKSKLQANRSQVSFLGRLISRAGTTLSPNHRASILHHPKPITVKDMLSFIGLTGYSRQYIPNFADLTIPLTALVKEQGMRKLQSKLNWTQEAESSFITLKQLMTRATDLALPDYTQPFYLDVSETDGSVNGILFQKKGEIGKS